MRGTDNLAAMKKTIWSIVAALTLFAALQAWGWLRDNRIPAFTGRARVFVVDTTSVDGVISQIKAQTGIRFEKSLRKVFERKRVAEYLCEGSYLIEPSHSAVYVARMLNNKWQTPTRLTLGGSLRLKSEIASKIGRQMMLDSAEVHAALEDEVFLRKFGVTPKTVFSLIIPDTYEIWWDESLSSLFSRFTKGYADFWTEERDRKAKELKLSRLQVSILASIVNCESNYVPEYPKIAGVYLTRLNRGMKLQADPTVAFCYDFKLDRILKKHLNVNSPYNTYRKAGLPPGPICCPSKDALDAVLNADMSSGYVFFCASPDFDGTHRFARTYKEHQVNSKAFQRELDKRTKKKNG